MEPKRLNDMTAHSRAKISRESALAALAECDKIGRDAFLRKYHYRKSTSYLLVHEGREYDSKAVLGVAFGIEYGCPPLLPSEFSGGAEHCARIMIRLGFSVRRGEETLTDRLLSGIKRVARRVGEIVTGLTKTLLVGLVSCTKDKLDIPQSARVPAQDLYSPSYIFSRSVEYLRRRACDEWLILSAKHGVLEPGEAIGLYDETLANAPKAVCDAWAARVREALRERYAGRKVKFVLMAGNRYAAGVRGLDAEVEEPLAGLSTGYRRSWLADATAPALT